MSLKAREDLNSTEELKIESVVFFNHKYEQRPWICKDRSVRSKAKQGNGDEPRIDQYRVR